MTDKNSVKNITEDMIRVGILFILIAWCYKIIEPFLGIIIWGIIIAVTLHPLHVILKKKLGGRNVLSAVILVILLLAVIIVPCVILGESMISGLKSLVALYKEGNLKVPPPVESVKSWPLVGDFLYSNWKQANENPGEIVKSYGPQIQESFGWVVRFVSQAGVGFLMVLASIVVSGGFLVYSEKGGRAIRNLFVRMAGEQGEHFAKVSEMTIRNVARGIIGVAFIQAALAGIGFLVAGVPLAGLWALIGFLLGIIQIGVTPVSIGVLIFMFATSSTLNAVLLLIWLILVGLSDNVLKPILLGKGAPVPMLVVFLGAIGGFMFSGFMGLFLGAIVLSLGYKLSQTWLEEKMV
jgi:predicted PurR-regulated permease PerM